MNKSKISSYQFLLSFVVILSAIAFSQDNLCAKNEQVIFSCYIGKKIASICGSENLSREKGTIYYAFGKPEKIELHYPKNIENSKAKFDFTHTHYNGDTHYKDIQMEFTNNGVRYSIYEFGQDQKNRLGIILEGKKNKK